MSTDQTERTGTTRRGVRSERSPAVVRAGVNGRVPRLGFLGTGWIGRNRMEAIHRSGAAEVAMICDPDQEMASRAAESAPRAERVEGYEEMLEADLDGVVIATPSALHARQAIAALERGIAVFCQKPLGRTGEEVERVVEAARSADRLLGLDLSYRHTEAMRRIREILAAGGIGTVFAVDLVFHNAYGPDRDWFYDLDRSGGGCIMDLGIHLVDLGLWGLGFPDVEGVTARRYAKGRALAEVEAVVEDYGIAKVDLEGGGVLNVACSWRLHAGVDARIEASFHGTGGGLRMRNVEGSFYDFVAERFDGTASEVLASPPDAWGGRAAVEWAERLCRGERFNPEAERFVESARVLDRVYGR